MNRIRTILWPRWRRKTLLEIKCRSINSKIAHPTDSSADSQSLPPEWEDEAPSFSDFTQLPHKNFGKNQLIETDEEFKRSLKGILRKFPPITYAFAYGSGVFPQSATTGSRTLPSPHPNPPEAILKWQKGGGKMIDFILTPRFSQHFHSLNLREHRDHYSFVGTLGSGVVSHIQESYGAGAYFNPYVVINGILIKYAVVNFETLLRDLTDWDTLYFAGRLHKPVKVLFEEPNIRVANQRNLISAVRCSLLLLPSTFTEKELYATIAGLSYQGDPRFQFGSENPKKIQNIITHQMLNFRSLYHGIIESLPNIRYNEDSALARTDWMENSDTNLRLSQDMHPDRRGNTVRRLPRNLREKLYFLYRGKFGISGRDYLHMLELSKDEDAKGGLRKRIAGDFDRRIAAETDLPQMVSKAISQTVKWPSTTQSVKGLLTAGVLKSFRYLQEKRESGKSKQ